MELTEKDLELLAKSYDFEVEQLKEAYEEGELVIYDNVLEAGEVMLLEPMHFLSQPEGLLNIINGYTSANLPGDPQDSLLSRIMYDYGLVKLPDSRFVRLIN